MNASFLPKNRNYDYGLAFCLNKHWFAKKLHYKSNAKQQAACGGIMVFTHFITKRGREEKVGIQEMDLNSHGTSSAPTLQSSFVTLCHTLTCLLPQTAETLTHGDATCLNSQIHSKYSYSLGTRFMLYIGAVSVTLVFFKTRVVAIDR